MNKQMTVAIGVSSVISLAAGSCAGFFVARTRMEKLYSKRAAEEIEEAKKFYSAMYKRPPYETPGSAAEIMIPVKDAAEAIKNYQGVADSEDPLVAEVEASAAQSFAVEKSIFQDAVSQVDPEDWALEIANRSETSPYVISGEEFLQGEKDYQQTTLTYYDGDDVLADERDQPVEKVNQTVGEKNLLRFGQMSNDRNVVYVRNDVMDLDFEILRSEGKYSEEVLGFVREKPLPRRRDGG